MGKKVVILGAGIAGISAGYHLKKANINPVIFEQNNSWGGLCDNFEINGFRFDKFVHLSFSNNGYVNELFRNNTEIITHFPDPSNYYKGVWLKHPAQNNLYNLSIEEKVKIIGDFASRKEKDLSEIKNYEMWLKCQYGEYFAENFPMVYTKKYWTVNAEELEIKWIGSRMYKPTLEEVLYGALTDETPNTYYAKEMRYPKDGGYKNFLEVMAKDLNIKLEHKVVEVNLEKKEILFSNGKIECYDKLISTLPLPELCEVVKDAPQKVIDASKKLRWTAGVIISIGFNKPNVMSNLWTYIYDKDIKTSRIYSPSVKSNTNVPNNCSSLQAEIYFSYNEIQHIDLEDLLDKEIEKLIEIGIFKKEDILLKDIRVEKYANVIFDHYIYENREIVKDFCDKQEVYSIGRFGEWEYLWSDQSLLSGKNCAEKFF